jgi:plastocyanin domain-containing protein
MSIRTATLALAILAALSISCKPAEQKAEPAVKEGAALEGRRIDITASNEGYSPATIEAKQGESLVLRFTRTTKSECLAQVVFPDQKITKELPLNKPVEVAIKAEKAGKIPFMCGMAMVKGTINVTGS